LISVFLNSPEPSALPVTPLGIVLEVHLDLAAAVDIDARSGAIELTPVEGHPLPPPGGKCWPREPITLRQGARVIEDSRRKRDPYEPRICEGRVMLPEEIQRIHREILSFERIEAISDPMREPIEDLWP
jgi:hypothetical protein